VGAAAAAAPPDIASADLAARSHEIHWPGRFAPVSADMFSHNAVTIHAGCGVVWDNLLTATRWPQWYPNARQVRLEGGRKMLVH
jgi:hypothetical protein